MQRLFLAIATAVLAFAAPAPAFAFLIDFTVEATESDYLTSLSHTYNSFPGGALTVTLAPAGGALTLTDPDTSYDPDPPDLALDNDGIGIVDDEITYEIQSLLVEFDRPVSIVAFVFLDLFINGTTGEKEQAIVDYDGGSMTFDAIFPLQINGGFLYALVQPMFVTDALTFTAASTNDGAGSPDYALAAIEVTPVPLPAAGWMLGAGILALIGVSRRRKSSPSAS